MKRKKKLRFGVFTVLLFVFSLCAFTLSSLFLKSYNVSLSEQCTNYTAMIADIEAKNEAESVMVESFGSEPEDDSGQTESFITITRSN